jgi:hypothetical protein
MSKRIAYTAVNRVPDDASEWVVAVATEGTRGMVPSPEYGCFDNIGSASTVARRLNEQLGLTPLTAMKILMDCMRDTGEES